MIAHLVPYLAPLAAVVTVVLRPQLLSPRHWRRWSRHRRRWRRGRLVEPRRKAWPARMHRAILRADGGRCILAACRVPTRTVDHVRPYAEGFPFSRWNGASLCTEHNEIKCNYWRARNGRVVWRPLSGTLRSGDQRRVAEILDGRTEREVAGLIAAEEIRLAHRPWRLVKLYLIWGRG